MAGLKFPNCFVLNNKQLLFPNVSSLFILKSILTVAILTCSRFDRHKFLSIKFPVSISSLLGRVGFRTGNEEDGNYNLHFL